MKLVQHLVKTIRNAANYDPEVREAPHCILWTDRRRQWQSEIPKLMKHMPELYVLGDYNPSTRTGPAIWLRCALAGVIDNAVPPADHTPVIYIPGYSTRQLRAVEFLPPEMKPLTGYLFRGVTWCMPDGGDWTVDALRNAFKLALII